MTVSREICFCSAMAPIVSEEGNDHVTNRTRADARASRKERGPNDQRRRTRCGPSRGGSGRTKHGQRGSQSKPRIGEADQCSRRRCKTKRRRRPPLRLGLEALSKSCQSVLAGRRRGSQLWLRLCLLFGARAVVADSQRNRDASAFHWRTHFASRRRELSSVSKGGAVKSRRSSLYGAGCRCLTVSRRNAVRQRDTSADAEVRYRFTSQTETNTISD